MGKQIKKNKVSIRKLEIVKTPSLPELRKIEDLRQIKNVISDLTAAVERLLKQQGGMVKDINSMRQKLFQSNLEKGLKNSKKVKKQFDKKKLKFLEKCGVVKKTSLTEEDLQRIKTRIELV